jgi:hypothetical protein
VPQNIFICEEEEEDTTKIESMEDRTSQDTFELYQKIS